MDGTPEPRTATGDWQPRHGRFAHIKLAEFVGGPVCGKRWDLPDPSPLTVVIPQQNGSTYIYKMTKRLTVDEQAIIYA